MDNFDNEMPLTLDILSDPFLLSQIDVSRFIDFIINLCHQNHFDSIETIDLLYNLNKAKTLRKCLNDTNHPSLACILCDIGNIMSETSSSQLALPFFIEQMRIEKHHLGCNHPDLAPVLFNIGQIYEKQDSLIEAKHCFTEALCLLETHKRKGKLYAEVLFNIGLIDHRQSLYRNAIENFDKAIIEYQAAYGELHRKVAEVRIKIGKFQLEIGRLQEAMDNFLEALLIIRMTFGNTNAKVAECLYGIGLIHEARSEFNDALNVLYQALSIHQSNQVDYNNDKDTFALVILHNIGIIHQCLEDTDKANIIFENIKNIIESTTNNVEKVGLFRKFGFDRYEDFPQAAAAA